MAYEIDLAGEHYQWDIEDGKIVIDGYDLEDEEVAMKLTEVFSPLVAFCKCVDDFLKEFPISDLVDFVYSRGEYKDWRKIEQEEYRSWGKERKNLHQMTTSRVRKSPSLLNLTAILCSYNLSDKDLERISSPYALAYLVLTGTEEEKEFVSANPHTPALSLLGLRDSSNRGIHGNLMRNPSSPEGLVDAMVENYKQYDFAILLKRTIERGECEERFARLKREDPLRVKTLVNTRNSHVLHLLAQEEDENILLAICQNKNISDEDLLLATTSLAQSKTGNSQIKLAQLKRMPSSVRLDLAHNHPYKWVRTAAIKGMSQEEKETYLEHEI